MAWFVFKIIITKPFAVGFELKKCMIDRLVDYAETILRLFLDFNGLWCETISHYKTTSSPFLLIGSIVWRHQLVSHHCV